MASPRSDPDPADEAGDPSSRFELQAFAGLPQALARLCLRDGRTRKEIAEAAGINASMFSGYLSGRRIPSLEHLDRTLTTLGVGIEELTYELRAIEYRAPGAPLVLWPQFLHTREGENAASVLTTLLEDVRELLLQSRQAHRAEEPGAYAAEPPAEERPQAGRRRASRSRKTKAG